VSLGAYVREHGVAAFKFEDFIFVGEKVATDPSRLILVGGQALEVWSVVLNVPPPTTASTPLTEDTDWLGGKRDAQWLCKLLGDRKDVELKLAEMEEPASTAMALIRRPDGRVLVMDFLHSIVGPSTNDVKRLAVLLQVRDFSFYILHPVLCLLSRLGNLAVLPAKRNGNGIAQAEWAIDIATAFLWKSMREGATERQMIKACHSIADYAEYHYGRRCYEDFRVDPLRAVTPAIVSAIGGKFEAIDWPGTVRRIEAKQRSWLDIQARTSLRGSSQPSDGSAVFGRSPSARRSS